MSLTQQQLEVAEQLARETGSLVITDFGAKSTQSPITVFQDFETRLSDLENELADLQQAKAAGVTPKPSGCFVQPGTAYPPLSAVEQQAKEADIEAHVAEASKPDWDKYRGNHHNSIPDPKSQFGGSVGFRKYLDQPLCDDLWVDIVFRLRCWNLRVYREDDMRWTDSWTNCEISVDDNDIVRDIRISPHPLQFDTRYMKQVPGYSIGHVGGLLRAEF